ncbi:MAG: alpha,alpha-trehalase [Planctomycetota bacterium]|nr:alpha,alpha-trehalase [Planctomycetota bacterium]
MPEPRDFPVLKIEGEQDSLLDPYRHACYALRRDVVDPGDESALKAPALRGLNQAFADAWDAAIGSLGLRWAGIGTRSVTDAFLAGLDNAGFLPAKLEYAGGGNPPEEPPPRRIAAPLFAFAEWEHFRLHGNRERLEHAFALLHTDFLYREDHLRKRNGLLAGAPEPYRLHATARFMLGGRVVPSLAGGASWVDASSIYALNARLLGEIARALGRKEEAGEFEWALRDLASRVNALMWDDGDNWYHDLDEHGARLPMKTLAGLWAVLSGVAPRNRAELMLKRLSDPTQFERAHPFATVSAAEGDYRKRDGAPVGVARPDFNLLAFEALFALHRFGDAQRACEAHLRRVAKVLKDSGEMFLAYDPDRDIPAPLHDGSSGANAPLAHAACIHNSLGVLMGLRPHANRGELELVPHLEQRHSIEGLRFAFGTINMEVGPADKTGARRTIELMCDVPFKLRVRRGDKSQLHDLHPGMHTLQA